MTDTPGRLVKITQDMMDEFTDEHTRNYGGITRKKDVRAAFVEWLHLNHNRYKKNITNPTAAALYQTIFEYHEPSVDEAIDANGDGVFLGLDLFSPRTEPSEIRPATTPTTPDPKTSILLQQPSQWTTENLTEFTNQIFSQIVSLGQKNQPLADVLLNLLALSTVESHLNTQSIYLSLSEFREDLRSCLDEIVKDHVEEHVGYQVEELKRRFDRVLDRHTKQINKINEWRNRFDDTP